MRFFADYLDRAFVAYGGGGKGGSSQPQQVSNQVTLPPFIQAAAESNLQQAQQVAARPYEAYPGQTIADITPDQQAAFDWVRNNYQTAGNTINAANSAITGGNLVTTAQSLLNPYLDQVQAAGVGEVQRTGALAQNDLAAKAASAGAFGGTRFGVQSGVLSAETARQAGDLAANIQSAGWDKAVTTALNQAGEVSTLATAGQAAGLQGAQALMASGQGQQNQAQAVLNDALQKWQAARDYPLEQLAINESALTSTPYGTTTTSTQNLNTPGGSGLSSALGGIGTGAAIGSAFGPIGTGVGAVAGGLLSLFGR